MEQMMMYTSCKSNYYLCYFLEIINDEKYKKLMKQIMMCISCMSRNML
jgi:hypothetical protein